MTKKMCTVNDCGKPATARGLRSTHYNPSHVVENVEWLIGTDKPERIAVRVGYPRLGDLAKALRRWGRDDLAIRLMRPEVASSERRYKVIFSDASD